MFGSRSGLKFLIALALLAALASCSDSDDSGQETGFDSLRNVRYCELLAIQVGPEGFFGDIYNTFTLNDCPEQRWNEIDAELLAQFTQELGAIAMAKNGPRFWLMDEILAEREEYIGFRFFNGIEMGYGPQILFGPQPPSPSLFTERTVARDTLFRFRAGLKVYELIAPLGKRYVMQSYAAFVDPNITIDKLPALTDRIELPAGWQYSVRTVDTDLEVEDWEGFATVVQDELSNTYQRVAQLEGVPEGLQGIEFLQISSGEAWLTYLPPDEAEAIVPDPGWIRSPLRPFFDRGVFSRSPDESVDGRFLQMDLFGHTFYHNVTVEQFATPLEPERRLSEMWVRKAHEVTYFAGSELPVIRSPEGEDYVLIATRGEISASVPSLPANWTYREIFLEKDLRVLLPPRTRLLEPGATGMSFQGPVMLDPL